MNANKDDLYKKQLQLIGRGVRTHFDGLRKGTLTPQMEELLRRLEKREREIQREIEAERDKSERKK